MARRRGIDPNAIQRIRDDLNRGLYDSRPTPPDDPEEFVRPSFIPSGHDRGPYFVGKAEEYYQGPQLSTRVAAHSFIPVDEDGVPFIVKNQSITDNYQPGPGTYQISNATYGKTAKSKMSDMEHGPYGYVFVRWHKKRTLWVYGVDEFVPTSVYRTFREYYSKGRAVVHMLEQYGHQNAEGFIYGGISGI